MRIWRNWQTRMVQVHVKAISCRFKSCYLHQRDSYPNCPFSHAKISENARKRLEYWGFDNSHNQVGFLSVSVKQDKMLSFLQPFTVRFAVRMAGFIDQYKRINPQTAVNLNPTAGKWRKTIGGLSFLFKKADKVDLISIVRFFGQCGKKRLKTRSAFLTIRQILPIILMEMYNCVVCARNGEKHHDNRRIEE